MESGAFDLHAKESQIRIIDQAGTVLLLERRVPTTRAQPGAVCAWQWEFRRPRG